MRKCPKCGLEIENDNAKFCRKCGTRLPEVPVQKKAPERVTPPVVPPPPANTVTSAPTVKKPAVSDGILLGADRTSVQQTNNQSRSADGEPISLRPEPEIYEAGDADVRERRTLFWAVKRCFSRYATFSGRASRSEFWYFILFNWLINFGLFGTALSLDEAGSNNEDKIVILLLASMLYSLLTLIPTLAVSVRRLHDIGKSGWNYLLGLVPVVGQIVLFVWYCWASEPEPNKWGPRP